MGRGDDEERRAWFRREVLPLERHLRAQAYSFYRRNPEEAEDLVHDTFAKLISHENWRDIDNVSAFSARVLRNLAFDAMKRKKIVPIEMMADLDLLGLAQDEPSPEASVVGREELRILARLIHELPEQCRRVFTLRKVYDLSHEEIAAELGLSVSTVEKHVVRGLRYCSERLDRQGARRTVPKTGRAWQSKRDRGGSE